LTIAARRRGERDVHLEKKGMVETFNTGVGTVKSGSRRKKFWINKSIKTLAIILSGDVKENKQEGRDMQKRGLVVFIRSL